jgi:predicted kinase
MNKNFLFFAHAKPGNSNKSMNSVVEVFKVSLLAARRESEQSQQVNPKVIRRTVLKKTRKKAHVMVKKSLLPQWNKSIQPGPIRLL